MDSSRLILNCAEYLNDVENIDEVGQFYLTQALSLDDDIYNLTVTILGMCVNKELSITLSNTENVSVETFPDKLKQIHQDTLSKYTKYNENLVSNITYEKDNQKFLEYLNNMVSVLLSGVKYIEKKKDDDWHQWDEDNEWNTKYRREERIRDNMKSLISVGKKYTKITIKYNIELPYIYTLAWDLPNLLNHYEDLKCSTDKKIEDRSYIGNLWNNTSTALKHVSENMLDILLNGVQVDREKFEDDDPDAMIRFYKNVSYRNLLPTIEISEMTDNSSDLHSPGARIKAKKEHIVPYIKKSILEKKPLVPMELGDNKYDAAKLINMMVDVLMEKNRTKDYLSSDIVYLKTFITSICEMVLHWIWTKESVPIKIERSEIEEYLTSIIKAANNVPRENTIKNREDHLEKLTTVIAKKWDAKLLTDPNVDENSSEKYIAYAYFSVLKLTRNWNEHNLIKNPSITFVVFLFMIAIRYVICIDNLDVEDHRKFLYEESKLFVFFKKEKIDYDKEDIKGINETEYSKMYQYVNKNAFCNGEVEDWAKKFPTNVEVKDPHQVLNTAGYTKSLIKDKMSEFEIYLTFWLSIHFGNAKSPFKKVLKSKDLNLMEIVEYIYNYQKESFLLD